jgi:DNA-binding response OmpR family regulator
MVSNTSAMTTILVVEDDPSVAELVRAVLNDVSGWGAIVAYDSRAALSLLEHVPADVLVVDVNLPGASGIEMLAQLRRDGRWHNPPVILMSANVPAQVADDVLGRDGYLQFLSKPFDIDDLVDAVRAAATRRPDSQPLAAPVQAGQPVRPAHPALAGRAS